MASSTKDGKSESDGPQAPFSYDIRVTGDIHPYGEEDDGRTTRVSVKITSNDDIADILQARRLGGRSDTGRPISIGSPRELLNVDINARVNPLLGDSEMSVSGAPSRLPQHYHRGGLSSSTSIPINRAPYYPYSSSPAPSIRSNASRPQLTITNRSNNQCSSFDERGSVFERKSSPKSRTPCDNGWSKRTATPQYDPSERWDGSLVKPPATPSFHSLKLGGASGPYNPSEDQTSVTENGGGRSKDSGSVIGSNSGDISSRFSRPYSKTFSVVSSDDRGDSTPASVSIPIQDQPPEPSQAVVLSRSLSPPPSLSRRQGSRLANRNPFPSTTAFPRSATPPPSQNGSNWYPLNQLGGYRPESAQSNVTSVTTTTTTTVQQAVTTSYNSQPVVHSREPSDSKFPYIYRTGSAARLGGAATEDSTASLHNSSTSQLHSNYSSFVTFPNVDRLQRAEVHRSQESCYEVCYCCNQLIEAADRIVPVDRPIHRWCLRCHECQLELTLEDFASLEDEFYCRIHYLKRRNGGATSRASRDAPVSPLALPYRPQSMNYRQTQSPSEYRPDSVDDCSGEHSMMCTCSCSCQFCPISLYGDTPSECDQGAAECRCDCLCSICVRAQAIQSNLGIPPPWTPGLEKSMVLYTGTHGPSSTLASRDLKVGGSYTPGGRDTPYTFSRSMHPPDQGCSCDCPCAFCPSSLYGMTSIMEGANPQACQCHCQCSICVRAQNIYDNFGAPIPQSERKEACLNSNDNTPCLLFPKTAGGNGDSNVFECPCSNCQDQRARDAALIERIMAYYYSLGMSDPSRALSPQSKEYIRLICPCSHCRKFREAHYRPTGSPTLKPRNTPAPTPIPTSKVGGSSQHQDFGKCPCPNCLAKGSGNDVPNSKPPSGKPKDGKPSTPAKSSSSGKNCDQPKDFGKCPCPNCTSGGPVAKAPSNGKAPSKPTPPPSKPKDSHPSSPKDFGKCPCPNCTSGGPVAKTPSNGKSTPPPSKPKGPPSLPPKDFGTCPCPNCTSGGPVAKVPSNGKTPSKPTPPPSKPKGPPSSPPKDFGTCPCPNCTSGGPVAKTPSNGKSTPPPSKPKDPPSSPPKDFGTCPCPNCTSGGPVSKPPPNDKTPSKPTPPPSKPKGPPSSPPKDFGTCPCPDCTSGGPVVKAPSNGKPPSKPSPPPSKPKGPPSSPPKDFGTCPCPNCTSGGPVSKTPSNGKPASKPSPPPSKPKGPPSPPKDFGTCPCPNCTSGGPVAKTPSNGKSTPPPSKPKGPPSSPPKDFGTCPCPNCTSGGPVAKAPSNGKTPSKPTPPPSKPKGPPSSPPKDFGTCPCPDCTSGGPVVKAPSNGKVPGKSTPPPSKPKGPPSSPPKDFGKCPCPDCQSGQPHPPTTPPPKTPSNGKSETKSQDNSKPHTFNCPCPECRYYGKPSTGAKEGGKSFQSGYSPALSACSYRTGGGEGSQRTECTCDCMCALCSLSPKYDIQVNVSVDGQPQSKHGGAYQPPLEVNKGATSSTCCCTCHCECCLRARKFCEPQHQLCKISPCDPDSKKGKVVVDVGADGRPNILVNGKLEETRKRHTEEFRTKSPRGSEWLTERIYDNYMRTVVEERQRRLNAPKSVSPLPLANSNRGGRSYEPAYHSPLSLSVVGPEAIPSEAETRSAQSSSPPINPAESVFSDDGSDRFDRSFVPSNTLSPRFPSSPIPLKRKSAVRQSRPSSVASSIDLNSITSSMFERRNEMANAKNNWEHPVCPVCSEICYLIDKVSFDGVIYHKQCLKCYECKRSLHASNCVRVRDHVYCTYHGGNLLRRRSMLIGPEANRPKPGRRRPPSSSRRKGGESSRGSSPSLSSTCHACGCTCHATGIPIQVDECFGDHCGGARRDTEGRSATSTPCSYGCGAPKGRGHSGGYRNATSPTSPPNNPFRLLNREMSSLEQRFKETEDVMRQSFRSKGISIDRRDASGSRGSGSTAHFPIRT